MEGKGISSKHIREAVITGIHDKGKYFLRDLFFAIAAGVLSAIYQGAGKRTGQHVI